MKVQKVFLLLLIFTAVFQIGVSVNDVEIKIDAYDVYEPLDEISCEEEVVSERASLELDVSGIESDTEYEFETENGKFELCVESEDEIKELDSLKIAEDKVLEVYPVGEGQLDTEINISEDESVIESQDLVLDFGIQNGIITNKKGEIQVAPGTYDEMINVENENIVLEGNGATLKPEGNDTVLTVAANNTEISGFNFEGDGELVGLNILKPDQRLSNISINKNSFEGFKFGVLGLSYSENLDVEENRFNTSKDDEFRDIGLWVMDGEQISLNRNRFLGDGISVLIGLNDEAEEFLEESDEEYLQEFTSFQGKIRSYEIHGNRFEPEGMLELGVNVDGILDVSYNYWGDPAGPEREIFDGQTVGEGHEISGDFQWQPYFPHEQHLESFEPMHRSEWVIENNRETWERYSSNTDTQRSDDEIINLLNSQLETNYPGQEDIEETVEQKIGDRDERIDELESRLEEKSEIIDEQEKLIETREETIENMSEKLETIEESHETRVNRMEDELNQTLSILETRGQANIVETPTGRAVEPVEERSIFSRITSWLFD